MIHMPIRDNLPQKHLLKSTGEGQGKGNISFLIRIFKIRKYTTLKFQLYVYIILEQMRMIIEGVQVKKFLLFFKGIER